MHARRRACVRPGWGKLRRRATKVEAESETGLAPWEIEEETEEERQARYKREAEEMKLKWDARRLEEKQSAERRIAFAAKEKMRAQIYGPRDPIMEAYEARMYEEARVLEVCRRQAEVYERIKAFKLGRTLPPKGEPYLELRPPPVEPPKPEDFDVSGVYDPQDDVIEARYKAPESYVSPTGPAPPPRHLRGTPRAAWEDPPYSPASPNARPSNYPKPGTITSLPENLTPVPMAYTADASLPSVAQARSMKLAELKSALTELGLSATGTKEELVERLIEAIESDAVEAEDEEA